MCELFEWFFIFLERLFNKPLFYFEEKICARFGHDWSRNWDKYKWLRGKDRVCYRCNRYEVREGRILAD